MNWKENFQEGKELVLATCSKEGEPNANVVISFGFMDDKLLIADCQMSTTMKNLIENKKICVIGGYYRILGNAEIFTSGKYFNVCVKKNDKYKVKHAILVKIEEVFNLNKVKKII